MTVDFRQHLDDVSRWFNDEINEYAATVRREQLIEIATSVGLGDDLRLDDYQTIKLKFGAKAATRSHSIAQFNKLSQDNAYENTVKTAARLIVDSIIARHNGHPQLLYLLMQSGKTGASIFYLMAMTNLLDNSVGKEVKPCYISTRQTAHLLQSSEAWDAYHALYGDMVVTWEPRANNDGFGVGELFYKVHRRGVTGAIIPASLQVGPSSDHIYSAVNSTDGLRKYTAVSMPTITVVDESHDGTIGASGRQSELEAAFDSKSFMLDYITFVSATPYDLLSTSEVVVTKGLYSPNYVGPVLGRMSPEIIEDQCDGSYSSVVKILGEFHRRKAARKSRVIESYGDAATLPIIEDQYNATTNICIRVSSNKKASALKHAMERDIKRNGKNGPLCDYAVETYTSDDDAKNSSAIVDKHVSNGKNVIIFVVGKMRCAEQVDRSIQLYIETKKNSTKSPTASSDAQGFYGRACGEKKFFSTVVVGPATLDCIKTVERFSRSNDVFYLDARKPTNGSVSTTRTEECEHFDNDVDEVAKLLSLLKGIDRTAPYTAMKAFIAGDATAQKLICDLMDKVESRGKTLIHRKSGTISANQISILSSFGGGIRMTERSKMIEISLAGGVRFATAPHTKYTAAIHAANYITKVIAGQKQMAVTRRLFPSPNLP